MMQYQLPQECMSHAQELLVMGEVHAHLGGYKYEQYYRSLSLNKPEFAMRSILFNTSSNHRLESTGLNILEELLFKMLGMSGEDSNVCLVCKGNWILERPLY